MVMKNSLYHVDREKLILDHLPLVKLTLNRLSHALPPHIDKDDLLETGIVGLIEAANRFDPSHGSNFASFAKARIRGAIVDELRSQDWVPRSLRQKAKEVEDLYVRLESKLGRLPTDEEMADALGISEEEYSKLMGDMNFVSIYSLEELSEILFDQERDLLESIPDTEHRDPFEEAEIADKVRILAEALGELDERERLVLTLYYYEELTISEIGKVLGRAKSTVSEIHTKALLKLKARLKSKLGKSVDTPSS